MDTVSHHRAAVIRGGKRYVSVLQGYIKGHAGRGGVEERMMAYVQEVKVDDGGGRDGDNIGPH